MSPTPGNKVVLLGMMSRKPVAGVVWQTMHYLIGFQRLGYDVYYVEAHCGAPLMFMQPGGDDGSAKAATFIASVMRRFDLGDRWAFHALHADGRCYGLSEVQLKQLYNSAALIINLHGATQPLPEHSATGRLVYLETDPVALQIELHHNTQQAIDFLEPHCAFFTFGENYGNPDCKLPVSNRFDFRPTRQPVVTDLWQLHDSGIRHVFSTVGSWRQLGREVAFRGETYHWSKHYEFLKFLDLPKHTNQVFELALNRYDDDDKRVLESKGWEVRNALSFSNDPDTYRKYIASSRGEFTVAKDQNVRLRSGWFSDRSATYLAAGRPVVTQETGFSAILPTGEGLFAFSGMEDIVQALESIDSSYERHCRAASALAREYFSHDVVLSRLLSDLGLPHSLARPRGETEANTDEGGPDEKPAHAEESLAKFDSPSSPVPTANPPVRYPTALPETQRNTRTGSNGVLEPSRQLPRCSVVIPVRNRASLTRQCLDALLSGATDGVDFEIVVVDDASTDTTQQLLAGYSEHVRVVTHATSTGFAAACNDGAVAAAGEYLVFLNNDTVPTAGWLDALVRYAEEHPKAAAVGSKLLFPNDTVQHAGVVVCQDRYPRHIYAGFPADHPAVNKSRRFRIVTAASVLLRRKPFEQVGGFDTAFQNGFEDTDLCLRLGERGYEIHYCHESVLYHLESVSEGRFANDKDNLRLYHRRWAHRVQPDDLQYYLEDGLLSVGYAQSYPARLTVSPLVAVIDGKERERQADRLLKVRSRQVFELLKETIRLTLRVEEAELQAAAAGQTELRRRIRELTEEKEIAQREITDPRPVVAEQPECPEVPTAEVGPMPSREAELRALLLDAHEQLLRRDRELESIVYNLQTVLASKPQRDVSDLLAVTEGFAPSKYLGYRQLVRRIREVVGAALPPDAMVAVVSKGDEELLELEGRQAWHFPQNEEGTYAGHHPADSAQAIAHLEALREKGAQFLLFPETAFWWLEHYEEFKQHLERHYRAVVRREDTCLVFALREAEASQLGAVVQGSSANTAVCPEGPE